MTLLAITSLALAGASPAPVKVFGCRAGAKRVRVEAIGGRLRYRFGRPGRDELVIDQVSAPRNVFRGVERMAAPVTWLRFTRGRHSYIVHHHGSDDRKGVTGSSGVTVLDGRRIVRELTCDRETPFDLGADIELALGEADDDRFNPYSLPD